MAQKPNPDDTLKAHLRVQRQGDRDVKHVLRDSADELTKEIAVLETKPSKTAAAQKRVVKKVTHEHLGELFGKVGDTVEANKQRSAAAAIDAFKPYEAVAKTLGKKVEPSTLMGTTRGQAMSSIRAAETRLLGASYRPLSASVYSAKAYSQGLVDQLIDRSLARGATASQLAREMRQYIRPDVPGGVSYAAMRLGRTEINNAFHAMSIERYRESGVVSVVEWHLSESHDTPDRCDEYGEIFEFALDDVPEKPHPQCFCYITPGIAPEEDFIGQLVADIF